MPFKSANIKKIMKYSKNKAKAGNPSGGKKAKKDYDNDGKIESGKDEYMGSRMAAAVKGKKPIKLKEGYDDAINRILSEIYAHGSLLNPAEKADDIERVRETMSALGHCPTELDENEFKTILKGKTFGEIMQHIISKNPNSVKKTTTSPSTTSPSTSASSTTKTPSTSGI